MTPRVFSEINQGKKAIEVVFAFEFEILLCSTHFSSDLTHIFSPSQDPVANILPSNNHEQHQMILK